MNLSGHRSPEPFLARLPNTASRQRELVPLGLPAANGLVRYLAARSQFSAVHSPRSYSRVAHTFSSCSLRSLATLLCNRSASALTCFSSLRICRYRHNAHTIAITAMVIPAAIASRSRTVNMSSMDSASGPCCTAAVVAGSLLMALRIGLSGNALHVPSMTTSSTATRGTRSHLLLPEVRDHGISSALSAAHAVFQFEASALRDGSRNLA